MCPMIFMHGKQILHLRNEKKHAKRIFINPTSNVIVLNWPRKFFLLVGRLIIYDQPALPLKQSSHNVVLPLG